MKKTIIFSIFILSISSVLLCKEKKILPDFTTGKIYTVSIANSYSNNTPAPVDIYRPTNECRADLLLLPGYNFPKTDWYKKTELLQHLKQHNICAAFPEMKRAVYASQYFKETGLKVFKKPSAIWVKEDFIPYMQKNQYMFTNPEKNLILGLSTGARGAVLLSLNDPGFYRAVAALSGDYDQTAMTGDRLMINIYGPYQDFFNRWEMIDNPKNMVKKWQGALFLGHGNSDRIVPFKQSEIFYETMKNENPTADVEFFPENARHDYAYWGSQLAEIFKFFNKKIEK